MFLSVFKVDGISMESIIPDKSYVFVNHYNKHNKINDLVVFKHKTYGRLIKKLVNIDKDNFYWFEGIYGKSISKENIGPVKQDNIIGKVILSISSKSLKIHL